MTTEIMDKRLLNYPLIIHFVSHLIIPHREISFGKEEITWTASVTCKCKQKRKCSQQLSVCSFDIVCYCHSYQVKLLIWRGPLDRRWNVGGAERNGESYYRFTQTLLKARSHSPRLITQPAAYVFSSNSIHYVVQIKK